MLSLFRYSLLALVAGLSIPSVSFSDESTESRFQKAIELQRKGQTLKAIKLYQSVLQRQPFHARAHYEIGWSYWRLERWEKTVKHWEQAKTLNLKIPGLDNYLELARRNLKGRFPPLVHPPIGTQASGTIRHASGEKTVSLKLVARFQHYNPRADHPDDHFDRNVFSPKSVNFHPSGHKAYVNALEGFSTLVFDPQRLKRIALIRHYFDEQNAPLFRSATESKAWAQFPADNRPRFPNHFSGKPVEATFSRAGRWLWIPYYRRDYDKYSTMPSAVALIDTRNDKISRVFATGPIPKYVTTSPDGNWLAVTHWGNNTVGLIDIHGDDPDKYQRTNLIIIGKRFALDQVDSRDRDHNCGYCLRGTVFTPDSRYLLVGRMGGGGIAVIDVVQQRYLGTVRGVRPTPRHLILSPDGETLYVSSSLSGYVSAFRTTEIIQAAISGNLRATPLLETHVGPAIRTIALSPDGSLLFAAINLDSKLAVLDTRRLKTILKIPADSYPVGLAVSPDGNQVWTTSQGRKLRGGNAVTVYRLERD